MDAIDEGPTAISAKGRHRDVIGIKPSFSAKAKQKDCESGQQNTILEHSTHVIIIAYVLEI